MEKKEKWMKFRHKAITGIAAALIGPYTRLTYGVKVEPFREQGDRQYLVVMNHQTAFDQFFIGMAFRGPVYYIASEDLFSNGFISRLLEYAVAPIPIRKQTMDIGAIRTCLRIVKEGGTIALAPEGNRTYSGKTEYMKPSIAKLARKLKLPVALFRIEGGYGVQPRWADTVRKGPMKAGVTRVIEPEEYQNMTDEAFFEEIRKELEVNEAVADAEYSHPALAEYLERAIYVCPDCGLAEWESNGDRMTCKSCGRQVRYLPTKELQGVDSEFPFRFVADWYDYQCGYVNKLDPAAWLETPAFRDTANLSEVILCDRKQPLSEHVTLELYGDRVEIHGVEAEPVIIPFSGENALTVLGRNKLNLYFGKQVWQVKGSKRFNALKYVNFYHHYRNISEGNYDEQFLGL